MEPHFSFKAGQYVRVTLDHLEGDPRGNHRDFSISSPATVSGWLSITTTVEPVDSPFKKRLWSLRAGDAVRVSGPFGNFGSGHGPDDVVVMVAGGIGVTPFRSIVATELESSSAHTRKMILVHSAKTLEALVFRREFEDLSRTHPNFRVYYTVTQTDTPAAGVYRGRITPSLLAGVSDPAHSVYYIAGPPAMVQDLRAGLIKELHLPAKKIMVEGFTGY